MPDLLVQVDPEVAPADVTELPTNSPVRLKWRCSHGHSWETRVRHRAAAKVAAWPADGSSSSSGKIMYMTGRCSRLEITRDASVGSVRPSLPHPVISISEALEEATRSTEIETSMQSRAIVQSCQASLPHCCMYRTALATLIDI
ncbi:zinc-ribbon domain-containing protein [Streptomyces sp. NPDC056663]|uniref:zinc-ribbon domain-containing protein n=1 Tax=Streptomyces sp. NPDC056663 TaxID=3345899 RepID=UPI0036A94B45